MDNSTTNTAFPTPPDVRAETIKIAKILTSLNYRMNNLGLFCDERGPVNHNAIVVRVLRDYKPISPFKNKVSQLLVDSVVTRFADASVKALQTKCSP